MASDKALVVVTGGSGFIAAWCIIELVKKGYHVRTTVRSLSKTDHVRQMLISGELTSEQASSVEFSPVDLMKDDGWADACKDAKFMLHVASPFPPSAPKDEDEVVKPALEGTLRALKAAKAAGIQRVVITSSMAAITYGYKETKHFTEKDWSVIAPKGNDPYQKSKTVAERAAWDWSKENAEVEVACVNPALVLGPILGKDDSTSQQLVLRMMNGQIPGLPQLQLGVVDVRDVADLHIRAMEDPKAKGERFICASDEGGVSMKQMSLALKERLGEKARRCPTFEVPNFVLSVVGL